MSDNKESIQQLTDRDAAWRAELRKAIATPQRTAIPRARMTELDPAYRITNSEEVAQGLTAEQALVEASRCLDCPNPTCVTGCPVNINIPSFIKNIQRGHFDYAARVPARASMRIAMHLPQDEEGTHSYRVARTLRFRCRTPQ